MQALAVVLGLCWVMRRWLWSLGAGALWVMRRWLRSSGAGPRLPAGARHPFR